MYRIGIDLGGTNIAAGIVDEKNRLTAQTSVKTGLPRSAESMIQDMKKMADWLLAEKQLQYADIKSVGVGVPGTANQETGYVEYANNLGFDQVPFRDLLEKYFSVPVYFENDANAAALGEYYTGGYTEKSFVMITLGTGVGGGILIDGRLWTGINHAAAEIGHTSIAFDGLPCNCGRRGCFEVYASANALIRQARQAMEGNSESILWKLCGGNLEQMEAKYVFDGCKERDELSLQIRETYIGYLAAGIANTINILQPEILCIGGGVSKAGEELMTLLRTRVADMIYSRNSVKNTRLCIAKSGNDAGIVGAAMLGKEA